jgi:D-alanyl-D-alanine carboxypeptidase
MKKSSILFFSWLLSIAVQAQRFNRTKMESLFNTLASHDLAIGSVAIAIDGKIIYQRSFGKDQSAQTEYRIGSITKMFTAVLAYQLIDDHRIFLSDTLSKWFPDLPNAGKITIAELLGHRSGLPDFTKNTDFDNWKEQPKTHDELLAMIKGQKPDFEPNARADYNNSNYLLLGYIIEKIEHISYKDLVNQRIIKQIGLAKTYYGEKAGFQPGEAVSYKYFNREWKKDKAVYLDDFGGAGAIISTPTDMCKFINAIFLGKLISSQSLEKMKTIRDGYGMGMFPYGDEINSGFGHNGKTEGFGSSLQYYPDARLAIAYCTNGEIYPKAAILDDVFKICFNEPCTLPVFQEVTLTKVLLDNYTGNYKSEDGNMQVTNTLDSGRLILTTRGRPFRLAALSAQEFWNVPFGFFFEFRKGGDTLLVKDVDDVYELHKVNR